MLTNKSYPKVLKLIPALVVSAAIVGCASPPEGSAAADGAGKSASTPLKSKSSVYFDFDRFDLKPEGKGVASAYADFLKSDTNSKVMIEGNADERGTVEYNLALGQKRAEAVRQELIQRGVVATRVEAVSNGEEKPLAKGSNETAWAENRRADLLVK